MCVACGVRIQQTLGCVCIVSIISRLHIWFLLLQPRMRFVGVRVVPLDSNRARERRLYHNKSNKPDQSTNQTQTNKELVMVVMVVMMVLMFMLRVGGCLPHARLRIA